MQNEPEKLSRSPFVSVVIPLFNREDLLHRPITSVIEQNYVNWELILVDDGSTDNSAAVCRKFCCQYPDKIKLIQQENTGEGGARNLGIAQSTGKYIAFLDSDDAWKPNFLEVMVNAMETSPFVDWIYCNVRRLVNEKKIIAESVFEHTSANDFQQLKIQRHNNLNVIIDSNFLYTAITSSIKCGANSIAKREIFNNTLYNTKMKIGVDRLLNIEMISKGIRYGYVKEVLLDVYSHDENISGANKTSNNFIKDQRIFCDLIQVYEYVKDNVKLSLLEQKGLQDRLSILYVSMGCSIIRNNSSIAPGIELLRKGFFLKPLKIDFWVKTLKSLIRRYV